MSLFTLIWISITVMLVLSVGLILFVVVYQRRVIRQQVRIRELNSQRDRDRLEASIKSEEGERHRIAGELHDDVGATLSSARLFLNNPLDEEALSVSKELLDQGITRLRSISHSLQPTLLHYMGLEKSLQSLIEMLNKSGEFSAGFSAEALPRLHDEVELALYRITQELINNVLKHSQATVITLLASSSRDQVMLVLTHNGKGMDQVEFENNIYNKGASGLKNILNRLKYIGGEIYYEKDPAGGYVTRVSVPLSTSLK